MAGVFSAHLICDSVYCRSAIGGLFARGKLLALVQGSAIYEADVRHAVRKLEDVIPNFESPSREVQHFSVLSRLVANLRSEELARAERILPVMMHREYDFIRFQIQPQTAWRRALQLNGLSTRALHRRIADHLRMQQWLDRQTADRVRVTADESLQLYEADFKTYSSPERFRASHIFLAAPPETPPETVDAKRNTIEAISARIDDSERFADLVALFSEDEATKMRGGDLGYFSESRMPDDLLDPIRNMRLGEASRIVRTRLGFHIIQLTDVKARRQMTFEESRAEIALALENKKRVAVVDELIAALSKQADFMRIPAW